MCICSTAIKTIFLVFLSCAQVSTGRLLPFFIAPEVKGYWPHNKGIQYVQLTRSQGYSSTPDTQLDERYSEMDDVDGEVKVIPMSGSEFKGSEVSPGHIPLEDSVFGSVSVSNSQDFGHNMYQRYTKLSIVF